MMQVIHRNRELGGLRKIMLCRQVDYDIAETFWKVFSRKWTSVQSNSVGISYAICFENIKGVELLHYQPHDISHGMIYTRHQYGHTIKSISWRAPPFLIRLSINWLLLCPSVVRRFGHVSFVRDINNGTLFSCVPSALTFLLYLCHFLSRPLCVVWW